ncbi:MAG: esterase family protein [Bacteroidaceae bacterium]|nr:esterase family protein [Bacteroidaceae bacterium]
MNTMKAKITIIALFLLLPLYVRAYKENVVKVWSNSMCKDVPVSVILPHEYSDTINYPVIYLLHGYSDNHTNWAKNGVVGALADKHNVIVVMPDGGYDSWYFDSPIVKEYRYETFVSQELISYVDSCYSTISDRKARAITGQSMGGHGAFYIAMRNQDKFANMGSLSGGLDIRPFPNRWNIAGRLGKYEQYPERWEEHTVINQTHLLTPGSMNIVFECGTSDFFFKVNCNMHEKLLKEGIPHDFYVRPGGHTWNYWLTNIKYQFMYFCDSFNKSLNK